MLERTDVSYECDRASLRMLRIQGSDDHLAPNALTLPAAFSVSCADLGVPRSSGRGEGVTQSCARPRLAWDPALSLHFCAWVPPAFAEIMKADFQVPASSGCA